MFILTVRGVAGRRRILDFVTPKFPASACPSVIGTGGRGAVLGLLGLIGLESCFGGLNILGTFIFCIPARAVVRETRDCLSSSSVLARDSPTTDLQFFFEKNCRGFIQSLVRAGC